MVQGVTTFAAAAQPPIVVQALCLHRTSGELAPHFFPSCTLHPLRCIYFNLDFKQVDRALEEEEEEEGLVVVRGYQDSIRTADGESRSPRKITRKEVPVVLRQPVITSYVCVEQACSPRAFAESFCYHPALASLLVKGPFLNARGLWLA
eukprot:1140987-Pelagomonas_calceolata.AAC.1